MPSLFKLETLKFIGGATIVLTAICIMLPGVMGYAFSLARLGLVILIAIVVSSVLGFSLQFFLKGKKGVGGSPNASADTNESSASDRRSADNTE
jgi:hypothetical protein